MERENINSEKFHIKCVATADAYGVVKVKKKGKASGMNLKK